MKIAPKGNIVNKANTAGIVNIENFEGATMRVSRDLLKKALLVMETMGNAGMDTEYLDIGISIPPEIFLIFFDREKTLGYGVAGAPEE